VAVTRIAPGSKRTERKASHSFLTRTRHRLRQRGQAVVEFGIVALLFTLLVFATIDFGLLLNTWIAVSSASREMARSASVGKQQLFLQDEASRLNLPSLNGGSSFPTRCCASTSAIEIKVEYFTHTPCHASPPALTDCPMSTTALSAPSIYTLYPSSNLDSPGTCPTDPAALASSCYPRTDDWVTVTVVANAAQVITPLIRPFFGCSNGSNPNCFVHLSSSTTMRYEGGEF
jgi:hypothetical protein